MNNLPRDLLPRFRWVCDVALRKCFRSEHDLYRERRGFLKITTNFLRLQLSVLGGKSEYLYFSEVELLFIV